MPVAKVAIAGLVLSAVGTAVTYMGQKKAQKAADRRFRDTMAAETHRDKIEAARSEVIRKRQIRAVAAEARRSQSYAENLANVQGAGGAIGQSGSTIPGIMANIGQQAGATGAYLNLTTTLTKDIARADTETQRVRSKPITAGQDFAAAGAIFKKIGAGVVEHRQDIADFKWSDLTTS